MMLTIYIIGYVLTLIWYLYLERDGLRFYYSYVKMEMAVQGILIALVWPFVVPVWALARFIVFIFSFKIGVKK